MPLSITSTDTPPTTTTVFRPFNPTWIAVILTALALSFSGASGYFSDNAGISDRVTAVEVQQRNNTDRLNRIETKIDRLLERVPEPK